MRKCIVFFSILFAVFFSLRSWANAWLQPTTEGTLIIRSSQRISCKFWDAYNRIQKGPCFHEFLLQPYTEYGLTDWITVVIDSGFNRFSQNGAVSDFNPVFIKPALKVLLWYGLKGVWSFQVGYNQKFKASEFGVDPASIIEVASAQNYMDIQLSFGASGTLIQSTGAVGAADIDPTRRPIGWYFNASGYVYPFFTNAATQLHFDWLLGFKMLNEQLILQLNQRNTISVGHPRVPYAPDFDVFIANPNFIWWINDTFALQGGWSQNFYGRKVGVGMVPYGSIWMRYKF